MWRSWTWDWEKIHTISSQARWDPAQAQHWLEPKFFPEPVFQWEREFRMDNRKGKSDQVLTIQRDLFKEGPAASALLHWILPPHLVSQHFPGAWKVTVTLFCEKPENRERKTFPGAFLTNHLGPSLVALFFTLCIIFQALNIIRKTEQVKIQRLFVLRILCHIFCVAHVHFC